MSARRPNFGPPKCLCPKFPLWLIDIGASTLDDIGSYQCQNSTLDVTLAVIRPKCLVPTVLPEFYESKDSRSILSTRRAKFGPAKCLRPKFPLWLTLGMTLLNNVVIVTSVYSGGSDLGGNFRPILAEKVVLLSFNTTFPYNDLGGKDRLRRNLRGEFPPRFRRSRSFAPRSL